MVSNREKVYRRVGTELRGPGRCRSGQGNQGKARLVTWPGLYAVLSDVLALSVSPGVWLGLSKRL